MNSRPLTREAVEYASRCLDDLHLVHLNESPDERKDAMGVVIDSFGEAEALIDVTRWLDERGGTADDHQPLLLGLLFGLLVTRYHEE